MAALWPVLTREAGLSAIEEDPFTFCDVTLQPDGIVFMLMHLMSRCTAETQPMYAPYGFIDMASGLDFHCEAQMEGDTDVGVS